MAKRQKKDYKKILETFLLTLLQGRWELQKEHMFMYSRDWRIDYAISSLLVAVEYQGGTFMVKSGHSSIVGQTKDMDKFNEAQIRGWIVICVNPKTIDSGTAFDQIARAIKVRTKEIRYEQSGR